MSTVSETQKLHIPRQGTYLAFSIDYEATFRYWQYEMGDEARTQLQSHSRKTYVGFCEYFRGFPFPVKPFNHITVWPLQQGLCRPIPDRGITEDMCVPVFPEIAHASGREPIRTNRPLPWNNCYHPTHMDVDVLLPKRMTDFANAYSLDLHGRSSMVYRSHNDWVRCCHKTSSIVNIGDIAEDLVPFPNIYPNGEDDHSWHGSYDPPTLSTDASSYSSDWDPPINYFDDYDDNFGPDFFVPVVRFTTKLDSIPAFSSAHELAEELNSLDGLVEMAKQRTPELMNSLSPIDEAGEEGEEEEVKACTDIVVSDLQWSEDLESFAKTVLEPIAEEDESESTETGESNGSQETRSTLSWNSATSSESSSLQPSLVGHQKARNGSGALSAIVSAVLSKLRGLRSKLRHV